MGCSPAGEDFDKHLDVLSAVKARIQENTGEINLKKEGYVHPDLFAGWDRTQPDFLWAAGLKARASFNYLARPNDVILELDARANPSGKGEVQNVSLHLNGSFIKNFVLESEHEKHYRIALPKERLRTGKNMLDFQFAYLSQSDNQEKAYAAVFKAITLGYALQSDSDGRLIHAGGTDFSYYADLPEKFRMTAAYQNMRGTQSMIEFWRNNKRIKSFVLDADKAQWNKTISLPDRGDTIIKFINQGREDSFVIWNKIVLSANSERPPPDDIKPHPEKRPHILVYVVDTLRADHLSCYGYSYRTSPVLDQFAQENAIYSSAYANSPWTRPSGASILTGLYPKNHKTTGRFGKLSEEIITFPEILKKEGYMTAAFNGNGNLNRIFGFSRGFDKYEELSGIYPGTLNITAQEMNRRIFDFLDEYHRREDHPPLFLLIWTMDPHDPYTPRNENKDKFDVEKHQYIDTYPFDFMEDVRFGRISLSPSQLEFVKTRYDQEIYENDAAFSQLLDKLKELGFYEDMAIIFTSDHGEQFFEHGGVKHGENVYNESVHIPLVIKAPRMEKGIHRDRVQLSDIFPTVLDIAGIPVTYDLDGHSLLSLSDSQRNVYFENYRGGNRINAVMGQDRKLIYNLEFRRPPHHPYIPLLEMYLLEDEQEQNPVKLDAFADYSLLQELMIYRNMESRRDIQAEQAEIPPELEEELKALGYIKGP